MMAVAGVSEHNWGLEGEDFDHWELCISEFKVDILILGIGLRWALWGLHCGSFRSLLELYPLLSCASASGAGQVEWVPTTPLACRCRTNVGVSLQPDWEQEAARPSLGIIRPEGRAASEVSQMRGACKVSLVGSGPVCKT